MISDRQIQILRHALGIGHDGRGATYRNHFVTGPGSKDFDSCMALVEEGCMVRRDGSPLTGGDDLFIVTDKGRAAARNTEPEKRLTRSQRRYRAYLASDSGLPFGEWLRYEGRAARATRSRGASDA